MGVGSGTILTSAHSRQKSFKVLSERLIETSKGRKTKAHPSPASTPPSTTALIPARDLGPCPGLEWDPRPHAGDAQCGVGGTQNPCPTNPKPSPETHRRGGEKGELGVEGKSPHGGRELHEREKSEKSTILDSVMLHIYISVYIYIYISI